MDTSVFERAAVLAAHRAAHAATLHLRPIQVGQRVAFVVGGEWHYAHVHALGLGRDGMPVASLRMAGAAWLHVEALEDLHAVCGECPDCRALNQRPRCVS